MAEVAARTYGEDPVRSNADEPLLVPHRLPGPPVEAVLLERENRFLARCRLPDGLKVHAHVPDRGRLLGILIPGARVWLFRATGEQRRTAWSLLIAEDPVAHVRLAIDPAGANDRVLPLLQQGRIRSLGPGWTIQREVRLGESRIDFVLTRDGEAVSIEVKSVGVVRHRVALFPDAPTTRGVRHIAELERFVRQRQRGVRRRAMLLLVAQREDADSVSPDAEIDPAFAHAVRKASTAVELCAVRFDVRPDGCLFSGEIPFVLA